MAPGQNHSIGLMTNTKRILITSALPYINGVKHLGNRRVPHDKPFLQLPNVIGSPHNSASVADASDVGLRHALANAGVL